MPERLLGLHHLDYWHCTVAQRSQPGWPDYAVFGSGWLAFVELKARREDNSKGKVSVAQERYRDAIRLAGGEWCSFLLPDQWEDVDAYHHAAQATARPFWHPPRHRAANSKGSHYRQQGCGQGS